MVGRSGPPATTTTVDTTGRMPGRCRTRRTRTPGQDLWGAKTRFTPPHRTGDLQAERSLHTHNGVTITSNTTSRGAAISKRTGPRCRTVPPVRLQVGVWFGPANPMSRGPCRDASHFHHSATSCCVQPSPTSSAKRSFFFGSIGWRGRLAGSVGGMRHVAIPFSHAGSTLVRDGVT